MANHGVLGYLAVIVLKVDNYDLNCKVYLITEFDMPFYNRALCF